MLFRSLAGTSFGRSRGVMRSSQGEIGNSDEAPQRSIGRAAASAIFVQPASMSAAMVMQSADHIGAANMVDARLGEGLFVRLDGQRSNP